MTAGSERRYRTTRTARTGWNLWRNRCNGREYGRTQTLRFADSDAGQRSGNEEMGDGRLPHQDRHLERFHDERSVGHGWTQNLRGSNSDQRQGRCQQKVRRRQQRKRNIQRRIDHNESAGHPPSA